MNIAIIVKEFPPEVIGGTETQTMQMAGELANSGHNVTVFTKRYHDTHDDSRFEYEVRRIWNFDQTPFLSTLTFLITSLFVLSRRADEFDCIQCMMLYPIGFLGYITNVITGTPYFAWVRGGDYYLMREVWWKHLMMRVVLSDTLVLTQAEDIRRDIEKDFSYIDTNIAILGNGVSIPEDQSTCSNGTILYLGRLAPKKGLKYLVQAADRLTSSYELVIVGDGPRRDQLEKQADQLDINVTFEGLVNPEAVGEYYRHSDIFVIPSIEGEGIPNAMLEAMSWGVPIIGTNSGGVGETIKEGETGYIVPMRNSSVLAKRIQELLDNPDKRQEMGHNAREYVQEHHSWEELVQSLETIYRSEPSGNR